ncbi:retrovirus-related pol polyprotein from transposon TNT 1-94 [Tanacetum coccineum]
MQTQTSSTLHNVIMEAGGKDRPPMLAPEGSTEMTTEGHMENYKNGLKMISTPQLCLVLINDMIEAIEGTLVVQQSGIQCYNCKEYEHVAKECQKPKQVKDSAYHKENMLLCKQEEAGIQLSVEQVDWRDDTDYDLMLKMKAHYMDNAKDPEQHPEQPESINDTYLDEQDDTNIIIDLLDMSYNREKADQDDEDDSLTQERVIPTTSVSIPQLKSNQLEDRVMHNNSQRKKQEVEDYRRNFKFLTRKTRLEMMQIAPILGYGDLVQENVTIKRVYYVEGLNHNLFSVGQICDADLEVAFRKSTCYIRDLKGNDVLTGKAKRKSFKTKTTPSSKRRLQILHMDLCGPMRVESINGKKYVLVIVDDYSRYTWTHFLRSKDETPKVLIDFLKLVQRGLHAQVRTIRTDKGTKFLNKTLHAYFAQEGIEHQTSTARTPERNDIVKRQNRTLVEAARTMLSAAKVPFLMFDELFNGSTPVVSKSFAVIAVDAPDQHQQQNITAYTSTTITADTPPLNIQKTHVTTSQAPTQAPTVTATENINQVETQKENTQVNEDEFINIFSTTVHEQGETSSQYVDSSNMHTFYQRHPFEHLITPRILDIIMSDSEHSTITYLTELEYSDMGSPGVDGPPSPDYLRKQPLPAVCFPTSELTVYIPESDPEEDPEDEEDPEEDPAYYPADIGDDDEEDEEEEHLAPADSTVVALPAVDRTDSISFLILTISPTTISTTFPKYYLHLLPLVLRFPRLFTLLGRGSSCFSYPYLRGGRLQRRCLLGMMYLP